MLPTRFIISRRPEEYLVQGPSHCGAYSVKGILSAFGLDSRGHPKEYHANWFCRLTGATLGKQYWVNILKSYDVDSKIDSADDLSDEERLNLLKNLLSKDMPVMIRIGNGYFHSKGYNPILGKIVGHWITLWGYNDQKKIFYVYDSGLLKKHWDKELPTGNTTRTYQELLRDWNYGRWQPWSWYISPQNYLYIKINKPN